MSLKLAPKDPTQLPEGWHSEWYPSENENWLVGLYESTSLKVGVAILVADVNEKENETVHPIAVTNEIRSTVDKRSYEIMHVEKTISDAFEFARRSMKTLNREFFNKNIDFYSTAKIELADENTNVSNISSKITNDLCRAHKHHGDGIRCCNCSNSISSQFPLFATAEKRESQWKIKNYHCSDCRPERSEIEQSQKDKNITLVVLSVSHASRRIIRVSGVQVLFHLLKI